MFAPSWLNIYLSLLTGEKRFGRFYTLPAGDIAVFCGGDPKGENKCCFLEFWTNFPRSSLSILVFFSWFLNQWLFLICDLWVSPVDMPSLSPVLFLIFWGSNTVSTIIFSLSDWSLWSSSEISIIDFSLSWKSFLLWLLYDEPVLTRLFRSFLAFGNGSGFFNLAFLYSGV